MAPKLKLKLKRGAKKSKPEQEEGPENKKKKKEGERKRFSLPSLPKLKIPKWLRRRSGEQIDDLPVSPTPLAAINLPGPSSRTMPGIRHFPMHAIALPPAKISTPEDLGSFELSSGYIPGEQVDDTSLFRTLPAPVMQAAKRSTYTPTDINLPGPSSMPMYIPAEQIDDIPLSVTPPTPVMQAAKRSIYIYAPTDLQIPGSSSRPMYMPAQQIADLPPLLMQAEKRSAFLLYPTAVHSSGSIEVPTNPDESGPIISVQKAMRWHRDKYHIKSSDDSESEYEMSDIEGTLKSNSSWNSEGWDISVPSERTSISPVKYSQLRTLVTSKRPIVIYYPLYHHFERKKKSDDDIVDKATILLLQQCVGEECKNAIKQLKICQLCFEMTKSLQPLDLLNNLFQLREMQFHFINTIANIDKFGENEFAFFSEVADTHYIYSRHMILNLKAHEKEATPYLYDTYKFVVEQLEQTSQAFQPMQKMTPITEIGL